MKKIENERKSLSKNRNFVLKRKKSINFRNLFLNNKPKKGKKVLLFFLFKQKTF